VKKATIIIIVVVVVAAGISTAVILGGWPGILIGSGNLETKEYALADFTAVEISSAFEFEAEQSGSFSINVTADDNAMDYVQVVKDGQTLKIGFQNAPGFRRITLKASITLPQLRGLAVSGASRGTISGFSSSEDLDVAVSGASRVTGDITAGNAEFGISGASTIQLEGAANDMVAQVSGASRFNLEDFAVDNADVNISGASTGTINLTGRLDANVSGASTLLYIGEPTMGDISVTGASTLRQK
jgi:Putative auto-transporter adhesin, head GIN domain